MKEAGVATRRRADRRVPDHADPDLLGHIAEIRRLEAGEAITRARGEQHITARQQRGVHRKDLRMERQRLPRPHIRSISHDGPP